MSIYFRTSHTLTAICVAREFVNASIKEAVFVGEYAKFTCKHGLLAGHDTNAGLVMCGPDKKFRVPECKRML